MERSLPPLELILAPAGCGKTREIIRRVESERGLTIILVPGAEQRLPLQRALPHPQRARVMQFATLARRVLRNTPHLARLLTATERLVLVRRVLAGAAHEGALRTYGGVAALPGFVAQTAAFLADLGEAAVSPAQFAAAAQRDHDHDMALVYGRYRAALAMHGLADLSLRLLYATETLQQRGYRLAGVGMVIVDGFDQFSPAQIAFLQALAGVVPMTMTLTGDASVRPAHRRFATTRQHLHDLFAVREVLLDRPTDCRAPVLEALEERLFELAPRSPFPAGDGVMLLEAPDREREVRAALGRVQMLLADGVAPDQIAVLARELSPYTALLREVADEYGLNLALPQGEPLPALPAVATLLALLRLSADDWPRRALMDVLRSPYLAALPAALRPDPVALDALARSSGVAGGRDVWQATLERLRSSEPDTSLPDTFARFAEWATPPEQATLPDGVAWVRERLALLSVAAASDDNAFAERDAAALNTADALLTRLGNAAALAGAQVLPLEHWRAEVERVLLDGRSRAMRGSVAVLSVLAARGLAFDHVLLLGLSEGVFPQPLATPALYSRADRRDLRRRGIPLTLPEPADERTLFYEAVTRARRTLFLSRTRLDERGTTLGRSPFLHHLLGLLEDVPVTVIRAGAAPDAAAARSPQERLLAGAVTDALPTDEPLTAHVQHAIAVERHRENAHAPYGPHEGMVRGPVTHHAAAQFGPNHLWSMTQINDYTTCPFRFAAAHLLQIEPHTEPERALDPSRRGQLFHAILQRAGERWQREHLPAAPEHRERILSALDAAATDVLRTAPETFGFAPSPFWGWEQTDIRRRLRAAVGGFIAQASEPTTPVRLEYQFGKHTPLIIPLDDGRQVRLRGQIDRIDRRPDGTLLLIDYKSGGSPQPLSDTLSGRNVQLPIYALAARAAGLGDVSQAQFWHIGSGRGSRVLSGDAMETAQAAARQRLQATLDGVVAGDYAVRPPHGCPEYCQFEPICRRNLAKRNQRG